MAASAQSKSKKSAVARKPKSSPSHPPFAEMITDAIASLKDRTGSSQYAITKFIEEKHKHLPPTFRKLLLNNLKKSVAAGKLVKVKNSFKLPPKKPAPATTKPTKSTVKAVPKSQPKPSAKPKAAAKPKAVAKPKPKPTAARSAKVTSRPAKTSARTSLGKRVAKAANTVKKPKSVKSPAKKEAVKKARK
ncbi:histone H1 [Neltuma alba]|uniref:histone H1 n=1 Tax=Neltuma alba TaxID=207710 RepID=UPI0010A4DC01|nr:histone H1-like [Prosopis alba]